MTYNHYEYNHKILLQIATGGIQYSIVYFINIIFALSVYLSCLLRISLLNKGFVLKYILTIISIFVLEYFFEIIVGIILQVLNLNSAYVNLFDIYTVGGPNNIIVYMLVNAFIALIFLIINILSYKNKEKVIQFCEGAL